MPPRVNGGLACSSLGTPLWPLVALASLVTSAFCQQEHHSGGRPRKFISYYGHREVQEGENFIIYCFADPKAEISWTKDGSPLRHWSAWQGYSVSDYNVQGFKISRLEVQAADADFSGGYSCSSESLAKHFVQVTAMQDSNGAQTDCHVLVPNESLRLRCGIAAPDGENLTWFKDGEELFPDNDRFLAVGRTLEIRRTSEDDAGAYGCSRGRSAMNDSAGIAHALQLVTPVRLEPVEGTVSAPLGARVNLECRAYARPDPQVTWLFGDRSRVSSPLLSVENVSVSHSGTYRCLASHERCARLVAESDVTVNVFESTIRTNEGFPGSGITLTPGADSLRLLCDYPADRSAKIVWLKENATMPSGGKYAYDKKDQSLLIKKPERGDVGNYSCVALGRIVNETAVIVVGLKVEIHPSQSKHFKEGHDGFLSCKVDGYPTPTIRWYRNGHLINAFKSSKFKYGGKRADDYGTLVIRRLGKHDAATFACLVDNGHSQDRALFPVVVSVPPSPLVPFFMICAEVALLTVIAFLFENHVRNAWMAARRMTAPKRERSQDRDVGRKRKSCTESDILRFISCLESSGDLNIDDLREPDPDEMPLTKQVDVAVKAEPVKSALVTRTKVMDVSAEPHVEFRPSENTVKVMVEPLEESEPEGVAAVEVSPEDNISPRKKSRKKKSRRSSRKSRRPSRKSRLSKDDSIAASVQEDSLPQADVLDKPFSTTAEKERAPKLVPVVEETLPMAVQDGEPLSEVSTDVKVLTATEQNEKPVSKASKVDNISLKKQKEDGRKAPKAKISPAKVKEQGQVSQLSKLDDDFSPTTAQGNELVPQIADVEAQKQETVPRFTSIPIVEVPTGANVKAKMNKDAELPAESALSRTKAKTKQTTKEPSTVLPAETPPCTDIVPLVQETEKPTSVRKGSVANQEKKFREKVTASEMAADNASRSSLDDFTYRKDSVSSQTKPSELFKDKTDRGPAVRQAVAVGTRNFLNEEEPCGWKLPERRIVEYTEPGSVVLVNEGAVSGMPAAEGDALRTRGISFRHGTKHEDGSVKALKRKGKKRKSWHKTQYKGERLTGSTDERPLTFGVHTSTEMNEMIISVPLSKQRDQAEKAGFVEYAEDTKVEGRLKDRKPPEGTERGCLTLLNEKGRYPSMAQERPVLQTQEASLLPRDLKAAQALPVQEPIRLRPEEKPVSCLPESELILRGSRQVKPVAKKQEYKPVIIVPDKYDVESPSAPPSPEEVTVRSRRQSCVESSVATKMPFPSRRKSDHLSKDASETEPAGQSAKFVAQVGTSEEPHKKGCVPPTPQVKTPVTALSRKGAEKGRLARQQETALKFTGDTRASNDAGATDLPRLPVPLETHVEPFAYPHKDGDRMTKPQQKMAPPQANVHEDLVRRKKENKDSAERGLSKLKPGKGPESDDGNAKIPEHDGDARRLSITTLPPRVAHRDDDHQKTDVHVVSEPKTDKVPAEASASFSTADKGKLTLGQTKPLIGVDVEDTVPEEEQRKKVPPESASSRTPPEVSSRRASHKKDDPTNTEAALPKSGVAEQTVPKKEQREKESPGNISTVDSPKRPSRRTSDQKVEPTRKIPGKLGPIVESPERTLIESPPTRTLTQPRQTLSRRTSGQGQPVQQKAQETPKPAVEGALRKSAPTGIIVATPPRQTVSRRTSGQKHWPVQKKEPEIPIAPVEVPESSLRESLPTEKNVMSQPEQTLSRRTSERTVEPIKKTLPEAVSEGTLAESLPTKTILATPARKSSDQKSYKEVTRAPGKMGPPVELPARVVSDSTSTERASSDGNVSHVTESRKLQEAPSRRTSDALKPMTPEKARHLVEVQDRTVSKRPFSESPVASDTESATLQEVPSRRSSADRGDTMKSKTPEKPWHLVEVKDSTMTERPSSESTVSESAVTEGKTPVAAQETLRKRSSQEEHASAAKRTRDVSERRKPEDSKCENAESDTTAVIEKRKQRKEEDHPPAPKGHVKSDVAGPESGVTSTHQTAHTSVRSPLRTHGGTLDPPMSMMDDVLSDVTMSETQATSAEPESSARTEGEERRIAEADDRSKLEGSSTEEEQDVTEEQATLHEGLQVPDYQSTRSPSESDYEPPMPSDLFSSTAPPELDWTQDPDSFYYLSIPPFEFAIPRTHVDAPVRVSPPETGAKKGKRRHSSSRKRRNQHRRTSSKHDGGGSSSGTFTPSSALEAEVDFLDQSSADRSGQAGVDRASTSRDESSRREEATSSQNRRVKRNK